MNIFKEINMKKIRLKHILKTFVCLNISNFQIFKIE